MKIKKAQTKNLREIGIIMKEVFSKPPFNEKSSLSSILKSLHFYYKKDKIYFAQENKEIIGVVIFGIEEWWEDAVLIIQDLAVKNKYQNKGIGRYLMKFVEAYAREHKVKRIYFQTHKKSRGVYFYKKLGYKINKNRISLSKKLK